MKTLIVSDLHLEPNRQAGTSLESRMALERWLLESFEKLLKTHAHDRLVINGDLFNKESVSEFTLVHIFNILKEEKFVIINRGNHDSKSNKKQELCALQLLRHLLPNVHIIFDGPATVDDLNFIPHAFDQATFDKWVSTCPSGEKVFIHANLDNHWAVEPDHSLNLSMQQVNILREKCCHIILGHEHAAKDLQGVSVVGCLFPTSIADCLSGDKRALILEDDKLSDVPTWTTEDFIEVDYEHLDKIREQRFVRINGECEMVDFPKIVRDIAKLRNDSKAFIISNNVKVRKPEGETKMLEEVTQFNIVKLLLESIPEEFRKEVEACI
jgi:DNA repair exonuclease SbcCD nuclease subunit